MKHNTMIDKDMLLKQIRAIPHPVGLDEILRVTGLSRKVKKHIQETLATLAFEGALVRVKGGKWANAEGLRSVCGVLSVTRTGAGFVRPEKDPATQKNTTQDIYIAAHLLGEAWHGDRVEVVLLPRVAQKDAFFQKNKHHKHQKERRAKQNETNKHRPPNNSPEGRVVTVLTRGLQECAVRVTRKQSKRGWICQPTDSRYTFMFDVDTASVNDAIQHNILLLVRLDGMNLGKKLVAATAVRSLGMENEVAVQERLVRFNHDIPLEFPIAVEREAQHLEQAQLEQAQLEHSPFHFHTLETLKTNSPIVSTGQRVDLRHIPFVTIDGADAKDFDDAVCVSRHEPHVLWVAIADVSLYVRPHSALDREAQERGNSYYFPNSVTPMLPEILSNGLCSLRPHEDRPVMAVRMVFSPQGEIQEAAFFPGIICSRARLTYDAVQNVLDQTPSSKSTPIEANTISETPPFKPTPELTVELTADLHSAANLAQQLIDRRKKQGGLDFDVPEAQCILDEQGRIRDLVRRERLFAHRLIEAFMLAANEAVARFLLQQALPFPLRGHPAPDQERLRTLFRTLKHTELATNLPKTPSASVLPSLLQEAATMPQAALVGRLVLRSMMQARYISALATDEATTHFGLASDAYCHFTSPIRRYADLMVHRTLKVALEANDKTPLPDRQTLLGCCERCNIKERVAQEAEREIIRRMACLVLADRVGERLQGIVSGVTDFGLFIEPENLPVDGMVRLETLADDWYQYDADRQELYGVRFGRRFRLGQSITVHVSHVHVGRLEINFTVADTPQQPLPKKQRPRQQKKTFFKKNKHKK